MIARIVAFVVLLLLAEPPTAESQAGDKVYRLGFLSSLPVPAAALANSLRNVGLVEGHDVIVDRRVTERPEELPALARELVRQKPDIIVAYWNRDIAAAQTATQSIPIVMVIGVDPVGAGLVTSLARPGGNVTGSLITEPAIAGKQLQALKEAVPTVSRVAVLWNPSFTLPTYYKAIEDSARASGMTVFSVESRTAEDFEGVLARVTALRPHALLVDGLAVPRQADRVQLVEFAARHRLPAVYTARYWVPVGGLMSYNASLDEAWTRVGGYVARILKGANPADLPIELPTKYELVINLKTAKALGLTIPPSLLLQADHVIE